MGNEAELLRRRNRELSILNGIAQALNRSVNLSETLTAVLAQVANLLELKTSWIWLLNEESGKSYLAAAQNLPPVLAKNPHKMMGGCYCLSTFRDDDLEGAANVNVVACSRLTGVVDGTDGLRYHASIPVRAHGKKLGVLNVGSTDWRELSTEELQLLNTIGDMLGIAVERARLFGQSSQLGAVEERNRLAREIHDTLAQGLTAVSLQLESVDALLESGTDKEKIQDTVQHALALTRANLEEARRSVMDLRATVLEEKTLYEAIKTLAEREQVTFELFLAIETPPLPPDIETGIYRIVQEALTNSARHANASQVTIRLAHANGILSLLIEDDGEGFDPDAPPPNRFGITGMNERARLMNGRLHLTTQPGQGTQIEVQIPIHGRVL